MLPLFAWADGDEIVITIKNHRFEPTQVTVPAGKKVKLRIENKDATPEEFESDSLGREKVVPGNGNAILFVGPLAAGKYSFYGDYHEKTAQGVLIAK
ncbi:MAG TPA: cupredoxin domain-containing protein [Methylophilaceae bacterium]|jgi:plastocyanin